MIVSSADANPTSINSRGDRPLLEAFGVTYAWKAGGPRALEEISVELARGQIAALIGPNGSGKSTLLKVLAGILPLTPPIAEGSVRLQGEELRSFSPAARARLIAYVPNDLRAEFPLTAREAVTLGRTPHAGAVDASAPFVRECMERASCWSLRDRDVRELSGGEKQLVLLARALAQQPRILLLDESLSRMDLHHQAATGALLGELASEGRAILIVAHDLNLATEWASSAWLLSRGRLLARGTVQATVTERSLSVLYPNARLLVSPSPATGAPKIFFRGGKARSLPEP